MSGNALKSPLEQRQLDAETWANKWLADGNEARERGDLAKADKCYAKSQFWLDRFNLLTGRADKPAPRR